MRSRKPSAVLLALAFVITLVTAVGSVAQSASSAQLVPVPQGQESVEVGYLNPRNGFPSHDSGESSGMSELPICRRVDRQRRDGGFYDVVIKLA